MLHARRITSIVLGGLAVFVATAALAWACQPNASISLSPTEGIARSQVTVKGADFTSEPVSIHWASPDGPVLATVTPSQGRFTVTVTVPQADPNVYFIYAVGPQATKQSPFEVLPTPTPNPPPTPPGGQTGSPPAGSKPPAPAATTSPTKGSSPTTPSRAHKSPAGSRGGARRRGEGSTRRVVAGTPGGGQGAVAKTGSGQKVFAGSLAPGKRGSPAKKGSQRGAARPAETTTSKHGIAGSKRLPSLTSDSTALDDGPDRRLGIGVGLLALGLVIPLAGFLVAEMRRRRAQAGPGRDR